MLLLRCPVHSRCIVSVCRMDDDVNRLLEPASWGSSLYHSPSVVTQHLSDICTSTQEDCVSWDQAEGSQPQARIDGFPHSQKQTRLI